MMEDNVAQAAPERKIYPDDKENIMHISVIRSMWVAAVAVFLGMAACGGGGGDGLPFLVKQDPSLISIAVTPESLSVRAGATVQLTATGTYSDGKSQDLTSLVTWSVLDDKIASIDAAGLVFAKAIGSSTVTAALEKIADQSPLTVSSSISLPRTGQTSSVAAGDDGLLQKGSAWPNPRFTANADTAITDNLTGLVWAPDGNIMPTRDANWDQDGTANDGRVTWQHALDYVAKLNSEQYLGHADWRLPNRRELKSLVNYGAPSSPVWINTQGFSNVQSLYYWSSSTVTSTPTGAWTIFIASGSQFGTAKKYSYYYVLPVRSGT